VGGLSLSGAVLTTVAALLFLIVFLADLFGLHTNPYLGMVFFVVLPAIFLLGLALIPLGGWLVRRQPATARPSWPRVDLNDPVQRRTAALVLSLTVANIVIVSLAAYRGVKYMDSAQFCGHGWYTVMKPEFAAYQNGAHARVGCVQCHVGSGASWFAKSKISGTRQLLAVTFHTYPKPIPSPVQAMRPAQDTCEQCHWPGKFHGDVARRFVDYADDENNTESITTLQVHVGGSDPQWGTGQGIHWHMNIASEVEYIATDEARQVIPWVRVTDRSGHVREYIVDGAMPGDLQKRERRRMDCMDCHNRPAHASAATPEHAVNELMADGGIPKTLPFVHREAVKTLKAVYESQEAAEQKISQVMRDFYRGQLRDAYGSRQQDVEHAVQAVTAIYRRNVFPEMRVQFGTYPSNIGHVDAPGCFRCHDDNHKSADGRKISQDCDTCHTIQ